MQLGLKHENVREGGQTEFVTNHHALGAQKYENVREGRYGKIICNQQSCTWPQSTITQVAQTNNA